MAKPRQNSLIGPFKTNIKNIFPTESKLQTDFLWYQKHEFNESFASQFSISTKTNFNWINGISLICNEKNELG